MAFLKRPFFSNEVIVHRFYDIESKSEGQNEI